VGVGLLHLLYVTLYVAGAMAALGAIGLCISSLTEHPIDTSSLLHGLLSFGVYIVIFGSLAWARFSSADVTS
jgi:hypothetical protein